LTSVFLKKLVYVKYWLPRTAQFTYCDV
jgi:hypothetical protein